VPIVVHPNSRMPLDDLRSAALKQTTAEVCSWPMPGAPLDEIDATLLTFKPMS
jgi:hypothetical protein